MARRKRNATAKGQKRRKTVGFIARTLLTGVANIPIEATLKMRRDAKKLLQRNKKKMQKFVADEGGVQPSENIEELAAQTTLVRNRKIQEIQDDPTNDANTPEDAEALYEEEQEEQIESEEFDGESDAFTEAAMGAILAVGKGVLNKVKQARFKKGKKFFGKTQAQSEAGGGADVNTDGMGNVVVSGVTNERSKDPLSMAINDAKGGAVETTIKQYLPLILIAVVLFFVLKKK